MLIDIEKKSLKFTYISHVFFSDLRLYERTVDMGS